MLNISLISCCHGNNWKENTTVSCSVQWPENWPSQPMLWLRSNLPRHWKSHLLGHDIIFSVRLQWLAYVNWRFPALQESYNFKQVRERKDQGESPQVRKSSVRVSAETCAEVCCRGGTVWRVGQEQMLQHHFILLVKNSKAAGKAVSFRGWAVGRISRAFNEVMTDVDEPPGFKYEVEKVCGLTCGGVLFENHQTDLIGGRQEYSITSLHTSSPPRW